jgi:hypothetical protein
MLLSESLFNVAREIERASATVEFQSYDQMSIEARSLLGVFLDFNRVSREKIAMAWTRVAKTSADKGQTSDASRDSGAPSGNEQPTL